MMDAEQVLAQAVAPYVETVGDAVDAAVAALAALRSAGFRVFRPEDCVRVTVFDGDTSETFPGWASPPVADDYEPYFLMPADCPVAGDAPTKRTTTREN